MKLMLIALSAMFITGCNTIQGFGKDVESVGKAIEKSAK